MVKTFNRSYFFILLLILYSSVYNSAQPVPVKNSGEIQIALEKFNVLGSVLYLAAHPDDENTSLIAYFSKGKKYRTGYLALTRGDGGQNLIGPEKGAEIGILRTQELMQARKIDGGEQFFTRAVDYGFSKSPEEAYKFWGKENILSDMVWVIRKFRPDVIITRFPPGSSGGHGHHTASAALAMEAFDQAADPGKFPEQLKYVKPWQTKRLFWNNWRPGEDIIDKLIKIDVGEYNSLIGKSYLEIAAESRSMHKSQGFGVSGYRGSRNEYLELFKGEPVKYDIFEGINTSWTRIPGGGEIGKLTSEVIGRFDAENPGKSIPALIKIYKILGDLQAQSKTGDTWIDVKKKELLEIIRSCAGFWMEAVSDDYAAAPGDRVNINSLMVNRSEIPFKLKSIEIPQTGFRQEFSEPLDYNQRNEKKLIVKLPDDLPISQPYWLVEKSPQGLFTVNNQKEIGLAENPPSVTVKITLETGSTGLTFLLPLLYRWNDRVEGELYRPFEVRPPVTVNVVKNGTIFPDNSSKEVQIKLKNNTLEAEGEVHIHAGDGWKITPEKIPFSIDEKYGEKSCSFTVIPPEKRSESELEIEVNIGGKKYNKSLVEISYPHIKREVYFPESKIKLIKLDLKKFDENIGYIMGSGDEIPDALRNLGYNVSLISDEQLENGDFGKFDVIIAGIRAYNTRERLKYAQPILMQFVKDGGTYITQYNTSSDVLVDEIGPYPFRTGRERITDENAHINFINPDHRLLNFPNKITENDFEGWVQERGLYFANDWDPKYETVISGSDPGEKELKGAELFTKYGKGIFIFSGISWFRELPAGVPGAYRLFVNMISAGKYDGK